MGQQTSAQQTDNGPGNPDTVWWCRILSRVIGAIAGLVCLICAIFQLITVTPLCIVSGLLMLVIGFVVLVFEAPICCTFIELTKPIGVWAEKRSYMQKGLLYAGSAIIPFALCWGLAGLFGCGSVFAAGVFYGLMALGRKADREQMMANASNVESGTGAPDMRTDSDAGLVTNESRMATSNTKDNPFSQY